MKALQGIEGQLEWAQRAVPACDVGQVRIRVAAAGLNRADLLQRAGHYPPPPGASDILGLECSGVVVEVGAGSAWQVGDRVCALLAGGGMVWWLNRSLRRLENYAAAVSRGEPVALPRLNSPELTRLGQALESMRRKLEGKAYVEQYVHSLTHELKSPLAALRGTAELLQESPPEPVARHFLTSIREQGNGCSD